MINVDIYFELKHFSKFLTSWELMIINHVFFLYGFVYLFFHLYLARFNNKMQKRNGALINLCILLYFFFTTKILCYWPLVNNIHYFL